mmetsp:Transcript_123934/g.264277  ORF Transcript_123934/g.264277 Transcript_123934/m.264277 type:complete len:238 (+) Transcript_123934:2914-3627(+)
MHILRRAENAKRSRISLPSTTLCSLVSSASNKTLSSSSAHFIVISTLLVSLPMKPSPSVMSTSAVPMKSSFCTAAEMPLSDPSEEGSSGAHCTFLHCVMRPRKSVSKSAFKRNQAVASSASLTTACRSLGRLDIWTTQYCFSIKHVCTSAVKKSDLGWLAGNAASKPPSCSSASVGQNSRNLAVSTLTCSPSNVCTKYLSSSSSQSMVWPRATATPSSSRTSTRAKSRDVSFMAAQW